MQLAGRTVFITGGGGGIGGGMAQAFAEKGARLVLADVNASFLKEEAAKLTAGAESLLLEMDVTSPDSWAEARKAAEERFGPVDVLCNNAGVSSDFQPLLEVEPEEFARVMAINVTGVFNGIQAFGRAMCDRGSGHIVNTSSMNGLMPFGNMATYSASKFAVLGLSDAVRQEFASCGVGVSTLFPGLTRSRMSVRNAEERMANNPELAAQIGADMMDPVWLGRAVVRAVEKNEPYIVTHPEYLGVTRERSEQILAAFGEPAQPGYKTGS